MSAKWDRMKKQMLADKKKLSLMISLSAVMLLLWGRLLLKQDPRTAVAKPSAVAAVDDASVEDTADVTDIATTPINHPPVEVVLVTSLSRDPFAFDKDRYPLAAGAARDQEPEKSPDETSDERNRIEAIREMAATLRFQAGMLGPTPRALINDRVYRLGDKINGFAVSKIESRRVVLEKDGIEIHLRMSD